MQGRRLCKRVWIAQLLTTVALYSGAMALRAQEMHAPQGPTDLAYIPASPAGNAQVSAAAANADQPPLGWESWKAEVDAKLKAIADREAAAKKEAASRPSVRAGGRIHLDFANFDEDPGFPDYENGTEFRRARIGLAGEAFEVIDYKIEMDFAEQTAFKDVYLTINELPVLQHVRIGHFKEPFSLEELTSSNYITFMERSSPNVFAPVRNTGIMAFGHPGNNENMTFALGGFYGEIDDTPPIFLNDSGSGALTMRFTYLPWYEEATGCRRLLHTGISYSFRKFSEETVRYRQRPEAHLAGRPVDTGTIVADSTNLLGGELALVYGPFSAQTEYIASYTQEPDQTFQGAYVYVSYFLTGESRAYSRSSGAFSRVKPFENFFQVLDCDGATQITGKGAWEIAYRYSYLDLQDTVLGGRMSNHTIGLNWYLNPYTRIMWNYVRSDVENSLAVAGIPDAGLNVFQMRAQIDF